MDPVTFWTAVGAIGTCVAAVAAVIPILLLRISRGVKAIQLQGRWKGDKFKDEWDFHADLRVENGRVQGKIRWKLIECSPSVPFADKVGKGGHEEVEGTLEHGTLTLTGRKVISGADVIDLSNTTIHLPARGNEIEGRSESQRKKAKWAEGGSIQGTVSYFRKPPPGFE